MFSRVLVLLVLVGLALVLGGVDAGEKYPTTEQRRLFAGNTADRARADASKFNQDTTKSLEQSTLPTFLTDVKRQSDFIWSVSSLKQNVERILIHWFTLISFNLEPSREPQQSSTNSKVVSKSRQLICIARKPNQVPAFIGLTVNTKRPRFMGKPLIRLSKPKDQVLKDYSGQHVGILPDFDAEFEISLRRETFRSFNKVFNDQYVQNQS